MLQTDVIEAMGMPFTLRYRVADSQDLAPVTTKVAAWLHQVDREFSPFRSDSAVRRLQRHELSLAAWSPAMQAVYGIATRAHTVTDGAFDPWFAGAYDPTGVVKGWAIAQAYDQFLAPLLTTGAVSAVALNGAGDMQVGVAATSAFTWQIGIADPNDGQRLVARYALRNGAVATSGFSQRGNHIRLQDANQSLVQATVLADSLITADVWATAALVMGEARYRAIAATQHHQATLVTKRHQIIMLGGERVA